MAIVSISIWFAALLLLPGLVIWRLVGPRDLPSALQVAPAFALSLAVIALIGWLCFVLGAGFNGVKAASIAVIVLSAIGLPISLMLFAVYLAAIYLAKVWVGAFLGRILLKSSGTTKGDWFLGLLVGLLILTIVGFIPYLGGVVRLGVVCLGLGAFAGQLYRASRPAITV